ncbi:MAG: M16 family metallopeptidase, partial [Acidobacteriota bacterium]
MRTVLTLFVMAAMAAAQPAYKQLQFPKLGEVKIPEIETFTLPNGMKVYLLENHNLPLINGIALVRTGTLFEPADKTGVHVIAAGTMRTGGTKAKTGDQLDEQLEAIAAGVESGIDETLGSVSFNCLKENTDEVLGVFHDVLTAPEFRQNKIDLLKMQYRSAIGRRYDDAGQVNNAEFSDTVYGKDTPFGRSIEYET